MVVGNRLSSPPLFMNGIKPADLVDLFAPTRTRRLGSHCRAIRGAAQRELVAKRRL